MGDELIREDAELFQRWRDGMRGREIHHHEIGEAFDDGDLVAEVMPDLAVLERITGLRGQAVEHLDEGGRSVPDVGDVVGVQNVRVRGQMFTELAHLAAQLLQGGEDGRTHGSWKEDCENARNVSQWAPGANPILTKLKFNSMERIPRQPLRAWGRIEALLPGHRCSVVMPNGYRTDAHLDKTLRNHPPELAVGEKIYLEFSTYDLANPRIIAPEGPES